MAPKNTFTQYTIGILIIVVVSVPVIMIQMNNWGNSKYSIFETLNVISANSSLSLDGKFYNTSWDLSYKPAYSIWLLPPINTSKAMTILIDELANKCKGTHHGPHMTLYGPIYEKDLKDLNSKTAYIATKVSPFSLEYKGVQVSAFRPFSRFRQHVTIRYYATYTVMNVTRFATNVFHKEDQQIPHTSLLYDHDGNCGRIPNLNDTILLRYSQIYGNIVNPTGIVNDTKLYYPTWTAKQIALVYTPLRDHFLSTEDLQNIVKNWKIISIYNLTGTKDNRLLGTQT